ncbi:anthranilate phosphoribosyltransferase [Caldibacillus lycopersici]|uniref:Anthranilate phosphoribosyltransferase n=1 Tax=Perspicuibacillus lycopersici TaxID=1325689 RepID=A0AAE3ISQ0_9BACI|nr:anthranilate phosphoribosyltransferase [Perspicuibacillus lycopersici]MCU9612029.1 anthranilate phosphoribosyltransferase [Perspicuibacillus lycopersici]
MTNYLQRLTEKSSLSVQEMQDVAEALLSKEITDSEIAAYLIALKAKGETVEEIVGIVNALRKYAMPFSNPIPYVMDNCGTGGDQSNSFNISSTSAFVIAGAGIPVAKHGNKSVSSKTGSADVLEALGVQWNLPQEKLLELLEEIGITFLFAPFVHPRMKRIMKIRKELKVPTIFNIIGPLLNPITLDTQLVGTYRRDTINKLANVLKNMGRRRAIVMTGAGSLDEASLAGENYLAILDEGMITNKILHPEEVGLPVIENSEITGGDCNENARILLQVLKGGKGAYRDTVLLNAGIGIFVTGKAASISEGVKIARESIDSGAALNKLEQLIKKSRVMKQEVI